MANFDLDITAARFMATDSVGSCVRLRISRSRTPTIIKPVCCLAVFTGTKYKVGRLIASQSASASAHRSCRA
jgi:hypothetical protein